MPIPVQSLDELDSALVEQKQLILSQMIQERFPEVDALVRGPLNDLVGFFSGGVSGAINQTEIDRVLKSRSLLDLQTDPNLADEELVDAAISNYLITRKIGSRADGEMTIVVTGDTSWVVSANAVYSANGMDFQADLPIVAKPPGSIVFDETNERVLEPRGDGSYEFSVPMTAVDVGTAGNIRRGTRMIPGTVPPRFVTAYAAEDFIGGSSTEDNETLVSRLEAGVAARVLQGRSNIKALFAAQPSLADALHYSIVGHGDPEMFRDQHSIVPISAGGRVDIYARTTETTQATTVRKTATLVEKFNTYSVWQISVGRNDAPGFYDIVQIRRPADATDIAGFEITSDVRGWDFDDDVLVPDIVNLVESAYSRYQTASVRFADTLTVTSELTVGDTADYDVAFRFLPQIDELQAFCLQSDHIHLAGDVLVKAAVPCWLTVNCDIYKNSTETSPVLSDIKTAMAERVNRLDFPGVLYASQLADVIHDFLTGSMAVGPIEMRGLIRRPDGTLLSLVHHQVLNLPNSPSTLVTPYTTTFFLDPADIGLAIRNRGNN